ncbi:FAD dependent oxidoreductase-domain-containing protein [Pisolithus orientalis]|uniref:FAD dependent oxidoreductase-domain-containing protein n=1 Tax=Pisolithus orientalis TaxID=936130 RepID=UPI00222496DA|nr:FAD dependent oxidoreductase-domain-containing protein [Pisolithus orientalis]KAI6030490.1 FAD dependent oxidoreductase-domain-containing protein [Pisolithus orientalis]
MSVVRRLFSRRTLAYVGATTLGVAGGGYYYLNSGPPYPASVLETRRPPPPWTPPSRQAMLDALENSGKTHPDSEQFDLLIVGGGATGAGVAVDAASRGLRVALVERSDFSSGTSSKSTKLVHGGVRYLQKAVMELDYEQYKLVREALHERKIFLQTAPYLSHMLPIMLPIYKYWQENMESSYLMSKGKALEIFPMLKRDGLVGAVVYYDGQHNDARMNVALIMTAVKLGATVVNYCGVTDLHKNADGKLIGAKVRDQLTGREFDVRAKGIINATGPYADTLLKLNSPDHKSIVRPSSGIHITLPAYYAPSRMGLLDPATSDGRVIFFLPWEGGVVAGTTDTPTKVNAENEEVTANEDEVNWVLDEVRRYLSRDIRVRRGDVLSAWAGLRPLIAARSEGGTEGLVRNHLVSVEESGLVTIAGGKWTTYRAMAEETVNTAVEVFGLQDKVNGPCRTEELRLVGSDGWSPTMFIGLIQRFGLDTDVATQLSDNYGDRAWTVCALAQPTGEQWPLHGVRLSPNYSYLEAEILYATRHEYACTAVDVLARRTRLAFVNAQAALSALPRVIEIMSEELGWDRARQRQEFERSVKFLQSMGLPPTIANNNGNGTASWAGWVKNGFWCIVGMHPPVIPTIQAVKGIPHSYSRAKFEPGEIESLRDVFDRYAVPSAEDAGPQQEGSLAGDDKRLKKDRIKDVLREYAKEWSGSGYDRFRDADYRYVLAETGLQDREDVDFDEFVEVCENLKDVSLVPVAARKVKVERRGIPVEKSGGGV